jgi:hypothetical protein
VPDSPLESLVGRVVVIAEDDYRYGIGPLRLRVQSVTRSRLDPSWALVNGLLVDFRGVDREPREVMVRVGALLAA